MHKVHDDEVLLSLMNQVGANTLELIAHIERGKEMLSTPPVNQLLREKLIRVRTGIQERAAAINRQALEALGG